MNLCRYIACALSKYFKDIRNKIFQLKQQNKPNFTKKLWIDYQEKK